MFGIMIARKGWTKNQWTAPVLLFMVIILAYGLQITFLGFYFDDWPVIFQIKSGADFWAFYRYDRPFSAWTYVLTAPILGTRPVLWHLFTLTLRWLTTLGLWWTLGLIWPKNQKEVNWIAILFAVYPAFMQQTIAVAYSQHFITFALYFLSCGTMVAAIKKRPRPWLLVSISIFTAMLHIFTMEYFWGLELVRPFLVWIALAGQDYQPRRRFQKSIISWLPYIAVLITAILLRQNFFSQALPGEDPNALRLVELVKSAPGLGMIHLLDMVVGDFVFLVVTAWEKTLNPSLFNFRSNVLIYSWLLVVVAMIILWFYRTRIESQEEDQNTESISTWMRQAFFLGVIIFIVGTIPIWITDKQIAIGMYSDRFALPGMWAASIFLVSFPTLIGVSQRSRSVVLSFLIALSIGTHFRNSNEYRWDWTQQKRFFWQLYWRSPAIEPNTAFFADGTIFTFVGDYPLSFAINTVYNQDQTSTDLPYWFFELDSGFHQDAERYLNGTRIRGKLRNYAFEGNSLNSIVMDFNFIKGSCLWLLDETDQFNSSLPGLTWDAIPLSNLNLIHTDIGSNRSVYEKIFGKEPDHQWCYYFQKASIARQIEDWEEVIRLETTLGSLGYKPNNQLEWTPFIEAHVAMGDWEAAKDITLNAYRQSPVTQKSFCALWSTLRENYEVHPDKTNAIQNTVESLECR